MIEMTDAMRRCMHREPALKPPPKTPSCSPIKPLAALETTKPYHDASPDPERLLQNPKPQRDETQPLGGSAQGKEEVLGRVRVRFTGYRVRPLDPDNFAGSCKDSLDFLRHCGLIDGDEPWKIIFETEQVKVAHFAEEKTVIEVEVK